MRSSLTAAVLAMLMSFAATNSWAACQKLGFTVNDYGKKGPIRDAKKLLDKYIGEWTAERGIKRYRTVKKTVSCELFLDVGFFDEHTCKATATFCWKGRAKRSQRVANN